MVDGKMDGYGRIDGGWKEGRTVGKHQAYLL